MQRRDNLTHFLIASVVTLVLILLMVDVDAQAQIAFVSHRDGNPEIYVMNTAGGNQRRLTNNRHNDWSPSWSPDGKHIAFVSNKDGHFNNEIYVMDINGGNQRRLTNNRGWDSSPSWSPDSKRIAFVSYRDGNPEIYVMNTNGKNLQKLTDNPDANVSPAWFNSPFSVSPAGKRFAMWVWLKQADR